MDEHFKQILLLLGIAVATTAVAKKFKKPYPISLVIVGVLIGLLPIGELDPLKEFVSKDEIFRFTIIAIFLPTLLGEASLKLPFTNLYENRKPILFLAFAGTLISYVTVGFLSYKFLGLNILTAFVFAALMAATDPISVLSIFKDMGIEKRLTTIVEGESLFNDGIAVVLFNISAFYLLKYIDMGGKGFVLGGLDFIKVAFGGAIIGGILGYLFSLVIKLYDDYALEIVISLLLFYGSFFIAEHFHLSGVIAIVVSGVVFGNYGGKIGMSPTTRLNINNFWEVAALFANSMVFLMVGLEVASINILSNWQLILAAWLFVLLGRSIAVYFSLLPVKNIPSSFKHILNWGGLKGSLSIALALSLPEDFKGREIILVLALSSVLFSLIFQGTSIKFLVKLLKITPIRIGLTEYENYISNIHRCRMVLDRLEEMNHKDLISKKVFKKLKDEYKKDLEKQYERLEDLYLKHPGLLDNQYEQAKTQALYAEYDAIEDLYIKGIITKKTAEEKKKRIIDMIES